MLIFSELLGAFKLPDYKMNRYGQKTLYVADYKMFMQTHTHSLTYPPTHPYTHAHAHTHRDTHTDTHTQTHTHTNTHSILCLKITHEGIKVCNIISSIYSP